MAYITKVAKSNGICPCCGQPMPQVRLGVRMYPQTARIFDLIQRAGREGISSRAILERAYVGMKKPKITVVRSHVNQARDALAGTDYRIRCHRDGRHPGVYKLVNVAQAFAAVYSHADRT